MRCRLECIPLRDSFDLIEKLCQDNRESFAEERKSVPKDYTDRMLQPRVDIFRVHVGVEQ